jgi:hypothetical protein
MKRLLLLLALAAPVWAQRSSNASGLQGYPICTDVPTDTYALSWSAASGCWKPTAVTSLAGGTVTSVGLAGTARKITVTGSTPITGAGSWSLTLPADLLLPLSTAFTASTTSGPNFNVPSGVAPTSPASGDFWNESNILKFFNGTATKSIAYLDSNITGTAAAIAGGSGGQVAFQSGAGVTAFSSGFSYNDTTKYLGLIGGFTAGQTGTESGCYKLLGTTSGTVSICAQDAAGTWTFKPPATAGTNGYFLQTNGSGVTTWAAATGTGDVTGAASSVDSEVVLFDGTGGKTIKRASLTGIPYLTSGVLGSAAAANVVTLFGSGSCSGYLKSDGSCDTPGGTGTVTVVSSGSLTSTAIVTGGGTTTLQTPAATATMDASGNISTPGSITTGAGGSAAGYIEIGQGTAPSAGTTAVTLAAPASVTSHIQLLPAAAATGFFLGTNSSGTVTWSQVTATGSDEVVRKTSPTLVTPALGTPSAIVLTNATGFPTLNQNTTGTAGGLSGAALGGDVTNSGNTVTLAAKYKLWECQPGLGDGLNAVPAGTYLQTNCKNNTGVTVTLSAIQCYSDNAGTSTMAVTNGAGTALLTGAVTCSASYAAGTQSATVTIANGDMLKFSFVSDGATKQTSWNIVGSK